MLAPQPARQCQPVHAWHPYVGDDDVVGMAFGFGFLEQRQRFLAIARDRNVVSVGDQAFGEKLGDNRLILNQKDAKSATEASSIGRHVCSSSLRPRSRRERATSIGPFK